MPNPVGRPPKERPLLAAVAANPATAATPKKRKDDEAASERDYMYLIMESVQYAQVIKLEPRLSVDEFKRLRNLYVIDRFYQYSDEEILERIGYEKKTLDKLRSHVHYAEIGKMVDQAAELLSNPRTIEEWANQSQGRVGMETMTMALSCKDPKIKLAALNVFTDRVSAKKGREDEVKPPMQFPPDVLVVMAKAIEMARGVPTADGGVDAGRLNVPTTKRLNG
jgi:hypothetical protein